MITKKNVSVTTLAHEIGHLLGFEGHTGNDDENMSPGGNGKRVRKWQADVVNP